MQKLFFLYALILPFLIACEEKVVPAPLNESKALSFSAPVVGHQSMYLAYTAQSDRSNGPTPITYTGDTLWLAVTNQTGNVYEVEATFSTSQNPDQYTFTLQNGFLEIDLVHASIGNPEFISPAFLPISLPLAELTSPEIPISFPEMSDNCFQSLCSVSTINHEQLGTSYSRLNLSSYFGDMAFDGPGYYIAYSEGNGIVRSTSINAWTQGESGWNLKVD